MHMVDGVPIKLVQFCGKYSDFVRTLRNNNKEYFIEQHHITFDEHKMFMGSNGKDYKICLMDDVPVGFIGCVNKDLRLAVHANYREKGIGKWMIQESRKYWPNATAKVKTKNKASMRAFLNAGLKPACSYITLEW